MDDITKKIEFKGRSGNNHVFVNCFAITKNEQPRNAGIYVFTKENIAESHAMLDIQLLMDEDEITATVQRMKEDGAVYAFCKDCTDEIACDAEIDDIKEGEDYKRSIV